MSTDIVYMPILKAKRGELDALRMLPPETRSRMMPLIEVAPIPLDWDEEREVKSVNDHLDRLGERLRNAWPDNLPFLVDLNWLSPELRMDSGIHPLAAVFEDLRCKSLLAAPVADLDRDAAYRAAVKSVVTIDRRGAGLRVLSEDCEDSRVLADQIDAFLRECALNAAEVDLILDLGDISGSQVVPWALFARATINSLPHLKGWRSLVLAATAFPKDLSGFSGGTVSLVPRTEWLIWKTIAKAAEKVERRPLFGDYGISNPELVEIDPRLMRMSASLRYTVDENWVIPKGRNVRQHGFQQSQALCAMLKNRPDFAGPQFSWGDNWIDQRAEGGVGPGNATTWRQVGTNHHLAFVVDQIAKFAAS